MTPALHSCRDCRLLAQCGGMDPPELFGCFYRCSTDPDCLAGHCDWTCPNNVRLFWKRSVLIGHLWKTPRVKFLPINLTCLPLYVPLIRPGVHRAKILGTDYVALSLYEALRVFGVNGTYKPLGPKEFRRKWRLRESSKVVLIGVAEDRLIEPFYKKYLAKHIPELLAGAGIAAVTAPNFSFFEDVPRSHSIYNRLRGLEVAEQFLRREIPMIPHLNALTNGDWQAWAKVLIANPQLSYICKEFQTGNKDGVNREQAVENLARLQDDIQRSLHPIIVGGRSALPLLRKYFCSFTIADSVPSIRTNKRQLAVLEQNRLSWQPIKSASGADLSTLLEHNLRIYRTAIAANLKNVEQSPALVEADQIAGSAVQTR
jgi:hypothetical protein